MQGTLLAITVLSVATTASAQDTVETVIVSASASGEHRLGGYYDSEFRPLNARLRSRIVATQDTRSEARFSRITNQVELRASVAMWGVGGETFTGAQDRSLYAYHVSRRERARRLRMPRSRPTVVPERAAYVLTGVIIGRMFEARLFGSSQRFALAQRGQIDAVTAALDTEIRSGNIAYETVAVGIREPTSPPLHERAQDVAAELLDSSHETAPGPIFFEFTAVPATWQQRVGATRPLRFHIVEVQFPSANPNTNRRWDPLGDAPDIMGEVHHAGARVAGFQSQPRNRNPAQSFTGTTAFEVEVTAQSPLTVHLLDWDGLEQHDSLGQFEVADPTPHYQGRLPANGRQFVWELGPARVVVRVREVSP